MCASTNRACIPTIHMQYEGRTQRRLLRLRPIANLLQNPCIHTYSPPQMYVRTLAMEMKTTLQHLCVCRKATKAQHAANRDDSKDFQPTYVQLYITYFLTYNINHTRAQSTRVPPQVNTTPAKVTCAGHQNQDETRARREDCSCRPQNTRKQKNAHI